MNKIMHGPDDNLPQPCEATYLDDATAAGKNLAITWDSKLSCLWRIARSWQPINLWKCKLLQTQVPLLGVVLADSYFQLGRKALLKLVGS